MDNLKEEICELLFKHSEFVSSSEINKYYRLHEREFDNVAEEILCKVEEYSKTKCIEQREICSDEFMSKIGSGINEPYRGWAERTYDKIKNSSLATDK